MAEEHKYASEVIDLPSDGKLYPENSPLREGKLELKYMTAKEEDILTSQNLIKKGMVIEKLLDSLILTKGVTSNDLVLGDKNAVMVAARILAYGPDYECEVTNPSTGEVSKQVFNLADCPFKKPSDDVKENNFEFELPISKKKVTFKVLTGKDEKNIEKELQQIAKLGSDVQPELTTRLRYTLTSVEGDTDIGKINTFVQSMLSRDSLALRAEISKVSPDIELEQEIELGGESVKVAIPMTVGFFWPESEG
tara:strand:+ start:452 stop:1204 length:753 start_codon:yes stop_codon:yes gene_type:complete